MDQHRERVNHGPEGEISWQFQVLQSHHNFLNELHKPVPDLVSHGALQLTKVLLQKPEQNRIRPAYDSECLKVRKV